MFKIRNLGVAALLSAGVVLASTQAYATTVSNPSVAPPAGASTAVTVITTATNTISVIATGGTSTVTSFIGAGGGLGGGLGGGGGGSGVITNGGIRGVQGSLPQPHYGFERAGIKIKSTGVSAGGVDGKLAAWINGGYSTFDEDHSSIDSDGETYTVAVGADWLFTDRILAGVAVSGETSDTTLTFNNGTLDTDGWTVSPYIVTILGKNRNILVDAVVGYGQSESDGTRSNGAITSNYDSDRWFAAANVSYIARLGNFGVTPKVGVLWFDSTTDAFTESNGSVSDESDTQLGRLNVGGRVTYYKFRTIAPYVSLTGEWDFEDEDYENFAGGLRPATDDFGATLGLGTAIRLSDRWTGSVDGTTALARDDYLSYTLSGRPARRSR
jgi:hypothetical protein